MLINCIAYQDGTKLADLPVAEINAYVNRPDCFVWVALKDATDEELEQMRLQFGLHELAVEDAHLGHQRPKVEEYGESVFTVMHLIEPEEHDLHVGEIDVFVGPNYILSVRNRSKQTFMGVRDRCEREPQLLKHGSGFVLYALIDAVVDRYFPIIDGLETELEEIEKHIFTKGSARSNTERLYTLKQKVMVMKHAVMPLTEAVGKLYGGRVPKVCAGTQDYFRDVYDHLIRMNTTIDTIRDTIVTAIQVNLSMVAIEDNEVTKRLAAWAGIFAVATALAGVWGMNFKNMPELEWEYGYPFALGLIATACFILYRRFKRAGWL
ncbi:MAG: magnesium/cobalt transporter CorA [Rhodospirillaceae bacterium]|nr:MAG: magnesium/cobalt transporter CorA [Rhodospirillaceae bacterium]